MSANKTAIPCTEYTWNPFTGCTKTSAGCKNCYASALAGRFNGGDFTPRFHPDRLNDLAKIKKQSMVFVCSVSDLFHEGHYSGHTAMVFQAMRSNPKHIYQILTKRPEQAGLIMSMEKGFNGEIPDNWWLGVTVENNAELHRLDTLRQIPAKHKFVSFEPLLEDIDSPDLTGIDWVIAGGETGAGARLCDTVWLYDIWQKCQNEKRPFFFKQWGTKSSTDWPSDDDGYTVRDVKKALSAVESTRQFPAAMMQHLGRCEDVEQYC